MKPPRRTSAAVAALVACALLAAPAAGTAKKPAKPPSAAGATQKLGLDLLHEMPGGNLIVSPHSIATALAMTGTGARGRTAEEMARTLHLGKANRFPAMGGLQRELIETWALSAGSDPEAPILNVANGLFAQSGFPIKPAFTTGLQEDFSAATQPVDFENDLAAALATVNGWVSEQTKGLIPTLFDDLDPTTKLVLANTVYLDAKWADPFSSKGTALGTFRNRSGGGQVDFMNATKTVGYTSGEGYQAVELPYRASTLSMLIVLPQTLDLGAFQRQLDAKGLRAIVGEIRQTRIDLSLPRFEIGAQRKLNGILARLGMPTAFKEGAANFKGMANFDGLHITEVMHGATIEVDEGGTIAGAATGVGTGLVSKPPSFTADHPFLFFLRDTQTGAVLFVGRLVDPAAG